MMKPFTSLNGNEGLYPLVSTFEGGLTVSKLVNERYFLQLPRQEYRSLSEHLSEEFCSAWKYVQH